MEERVLDYWVKVVIPSNAAMVLTSSLLYSHETAYLQQIFGACVLQDIVDSLNLSDDGIAHPHIVCEGMSD